MSMFYDYKDPKKGLYEKPVKPLKPILNKMAARAGEKKVATEKDRAKSIHYQALLYLSRIAGKKG